MGQILLVEDSKMFGRVVKRAIENAFDLPVYWAKSYAETQGLLTVAKGSFTMALVDYVLPDAARGEAVDLVTGAGISTFVFTSTIDEELREQIWAKRVADYLLKEDPHSLDAIVAAIRQLTINQQTLVLVVNGSGSWRRRISELLYVRQYRVLNAADGSSALQILDDHPEIELVITGYHMPGLDGVALCQKVREGRGAARLAILGMASQRQPEGGARLLKGGANDFFVKESFLVEEFYCRVSNSLETVRLHRQIGENGISGSIRR